MYTNEDDRAVRHEVDMLMSRGQSVHARTATVDAYMRACQRKYARTCQHAFLYINYDLRCRRECTVALLVAPSLASSTPSACGNTREAPDISAQRQQQQQQRRRWLYIAVHHGQAQPACRVIHLRHELCTINQYAVNAAGHAGRGKH